MKEIILIIFLISCLNSKTDYKLLINIHKEFHKFESLISKNKKCKQSLKLIKNIIYNFKVSVTALKNTAVYFLYLLKIIMYNHIINKYQILYMKKKYIMINYLL